MNKEERGTGMLAIRRATGEDLGTVLAIFARARRFMAENGNPNQWPDGYPPREWLEDDIARGNSYVAVQDGEVVGTFFFSQEEEPTYREIEGGAWLDGGPYGVIHRIASSGKAKGLLAAVVAWCRERTGSIRIDTHRDNLVMQRALGRLGFRRCGVIHLADGAERIAYQLI